MLRRYIQYIRVRLRYITWKKIVNFLKTQWAYLKRQPKVDAYPPEIIIDITDFCQLRCPLCFTGTNREDRAKRKMKFETLKKIIDELSPYALHIFLYNWGEPFLHDEIINFIKFIKERKLALSINTNLSYPLNVEKAEKIVNSSLDTFIVSIDGATKETYVQYRVNGNFDLVMRNLSLLTKLKRQLKRKTPFIEWQFLKMRHNIREVKLAKKLAKEIGVDAITFANINLPFGCSDKKIALKWFPPRELKNRIEYDITNRDLLNRCWWLWKTAVFDPDGNVYPCCYLDYRKQNFGNIIMGKSFKDIWNNEYFLSSRHIFSKRKGNFLLKEIVCRECKVSQYSHKK